MIIAYDLGTGGIKASLYREDGTPVCSTFREYPTLYPQPRWHEQSPGDWWRAVCAATPRLLAEGGVTAREVGAVALSGHSLVAVPLGRAGEPLMDSVPIWSDTRASAEAEDFFSRVDYGEWYGSTGNGDPRETYTVMKLMWLKEHRPGVWARTAKVAGSKDYVNFKLTGVLATDYSYASGCGMFDLRRWSYRDEYIAAAGLDRGILPDIMDASATVGRVTWRAAAACGLAEGTIVACGGVDNACMALGARGLGEGRVYASLGSSSWIAVTSRTPLLDQKTRPFIFAHLEKGWYTSGVSIFAAGSAYQWARNELCRDLGADAYRAMDELAAAAPVGAKGLLFNPSLAGGSAQSLGQDLRGSFTGLSLSTTRGEMLRAVLEGVAMDAACYCLGPLKRQVALEDSMLLCGGGSKSRLWRQIFADVFGMGILKTGIDQDAASLGAAACAARAAGYWEDFSRVDALHGAGELLAPDPAAQERYSAIMGIYALWTEGLAEVGTRLRALA